MVKAAWVEVAAGELDRVGGSSAAARPSVLVSLAAPVTYQVFETTVFNSKLGMTAEMLFVPSDVANRLGSLGPNAPDPTTVLGIRLGIQIPDPDGLVDVLYASAQGRTYTFDASSFQTWRLRWQADSSETSAFAQEVVFGERTPISESPLRTESMASLLTRGQAYVADGGEMAFHHPLASLGVVVLTGGAILVVSLGRAVRETLVIAAKWHLRRALGVPPDWMPPEDM